MEEAGLTERVCLFWNAVPWDLGGRNPRVEDLRGGARYLKELVRLLPDLRVVVALGAHAQRACLMAQIDAIPVHHPGNQGLSGGTPGARGRRWAEVRDGFARAAGLVAD